MPTALLSLARTAASTLGKAAAGAAKNQLKKAPSTIANGLTGFLNRNQQNQDSSENSIVSSSLSPLMGLLSLFGIDKQTAVIFLIVLSIPLISIYVLYMSITQTTPFPSGLQ